MQQPIWWFAGAGNPVAAPVVCVLGLGLNRECGHAERDHMSILCACFSLVMRQPRELSTATARLMAS